MPVQRLLRIDNRILTNKANISYSNLIYCRHYTVFYVAKLSKLSKN